MVEGEGDLLGAGELGGRHDVNVSSVQDRCGVWYMVNGMDGSC